MAVMFALDSSGRVVSASSGKSSNIKIWDSRTGTVLIDLPGFEGV